MKKVLYSLLVIGIVASIAGGSGAMTYFNDVETSSRNTFTAGTLDCQYILYKATTPSEGSITGTVDPGSTHLMPSRRVGDGTHTNAYFTVTNIKPGESGYIIWRVKNFGSTTGYLDLQNLQVVGSPGTTPESEPKPDYGELEENMAVKIWEDVHGNGVIDNNDNLIYSGTMDGLGGRNFNTNIPISSECDTYISLSWSVDNGVGNKIMDDSVDFNITFELAQTAGQ